MVIIDLETKKIIEILNTRDPEEVQKALNQYPNLHIISRDRGYSYRTVSGECYHIADRFHLIMNLSEAMIKEIKRKIPMYVDISINETHKAINTEPEEPVKEYTEKQKEKQKLIMEIKKDAEKGKSARSIAKEYELDRRTVSKYINIVDVEEASVYNSSNRNYSYLDPYKEKY